MNMHVIQSPEEEAEALILMGVKTNLLSGQSSKMTMALVQNAIVAGWKICKRDRFFTKREACQLLTQCRHFTNIHLPTPAIMQPKELWSGKQIFSCLLPSHMIYDRWRPDSNQLGDDLDVMDDHVVIRKGLLLCGRPCKKFAGTSGGGYVHFMCHMKGVGENYVADFLSDSQRIFDYMFVAYENFSIGPGDLLLPKDVHQKIKEMIETAVRKDERIQNEKVIQEGLSDEIIENAQQKILKNLLPRTAELASSALPDGNGCKDVTTSGSKGTSINTGQMTAMVGQQSVAGGRLKKGRLPCFSQDDTSPERYGLVRSSLLHGLNPYEFYAHAQAGREGLVDTAVKSLVGDTPIVICENGTMKRVLIGDWIDQLMDSEQHQSQIEKTPHMNLEYLKMDHPITIPTCDSNGVTSWETVTAITRHDPSKNLYKVTTLGGRHVIVAESKSLIVWNAENRSFEPRHMLAVSTGDYIPTMCNLPTIPQIGHIDVSCYLPKTKFIYGSDFLRAQELITPFLGPGRRVPNGWWSDNNGSTFILPYNQITRMTRVLIRSDNSQIKNGFVYPYQGKRVSASISSRLELNRENGVFIGLFLADGNCDFRSGYVGITKSDPTIQQFVKDWYDANEITWTHQIKAAPRNLPSGNGKSESIRGYSVVFAKLLDELVGHGSLHKRIPYEALHAPLDFRLGLLDGYFSGDGCIHSTSITASSVSKQLIDGISMLCSTLGIFGKVSLVQLSHNNLGTEDIKPLYVFSITSLWAQQFSNIVHLTHPEKMRKLQEITCTKVHRNFAQQKDVVLDQIVSIEILSSKDYPKLYDLTVPATLNFGLANGLISRDTAETGYIQRRTVRASENICVETDDTVRRWDGKILQIKYGGDGWSPEKLINCHLPYLNDTQEQVQNAISMSAEEYRHYGCKQQGLSHQQIKKVFEEEWEKLNELREFLIKQRRVLYHKLGTVTMEGVQMPSNIERDALSVQAGATLLPYKITFAKKRKRTNFPDGPETPTYLTAAKIREYVTKLIEDIHDIDGFNNKTRDYYLLSSLTIRKIMIQYRFSEEGLRLLCGLTMYRYRNAKCQAGEAVGLLAAESLGEPTTQMTLNSFHSSGVGATKLVTSGVPRVKELIALHKIIKMTTMTIAFHPRVQQTPNLIYRFSHIIVETKLGDVVRSLNIVFDPDLQTTRIPEHQPLVSLHSVYVEDFDQTLIPENNDEGLPAVHPVISSTSRYVVCMDLDQEVLIDRGLGPKDVARVVRQKLNMIQLGYPWVVMASEFNMSHWVLRFRVPGAYSQCKLWCKASDFGIDGKDARSFEKDLCYQTAQGLKENMHIGGIRGIKEAYIRKESKSELVIDTIGSNLLDVFILDGVDPARTTTNNLYEIESTLGIDYASDALFYEYKNVMDQAGASISDRHMCIISDLQCADGHMKALTRHGINQDHPPLTQISFEESVENMLRAALFRKRDQVLDVTSNVMLGQCIPLGTGKIGVKLPEEYEKLWMISKTKQCSLTPQNYLSHSGPSNDEKVNEIVLCNVQPDSLQTVDAEIVEKIIQYQWPSYSHPIKDKRRIGHISGVLRRFYTGSNSRRIISSTHNPCPLPVSLSSTDLKYIGQNLEDYTVRAKSDGHRYQLLLSTDPLLGRYACMVNRDMSIWDIAVCGSSELFDSGSMYDVELIEDQRTGNSFALILDVIQHAGVSFVDETWQTRYQKLFEIFDVSDEFALAESSITSPEEYDDLIEDEVRRSLPTTRCSKLLARHVYPNLTGFRFIPKSCRRLSELRTLLRQTENLTKLNHRCDGLIIQRLHGTVITGRDATILKWKDRDKITIDVKIAEDHTPLALLGDGTTAHIECSNHVRIGLSGNNVRFDWLEKSSIESFGVVGVVVECSVQLEISSQSSGAADETINSCLLSPVRIREKSVANTVYVISRTLENVVEGLTLEDVCKLLGISERGPVPEIEIENENENENEKPMDVEPETAVNKEDSLGPISPSRVSAKNPTFSSQEFYRPGSPMLSRSHQMIDSSIYSPIGSSISTCPFFRPGSPKISERDDRRGNAADTTMGIGITPTISFTNDHGLDTGTATPQSTTSTQHDVLEMEIVLPQEVPEVHSMENDPLFTVVD